MAALPVANLAALRVTLRFRRIPELTHAVEFDIAAPVFEEPDQLYRFGWENLFRNDYVSTDVDFRGFSSENQVVLQDHVIIPAGDIEHENVQRSIAGQIGVVNERGLVLLLVMQWRRVGHADWEWYSADAVDWQTFRASVGEIFAYGVLLAQFNVPAFSAERYILRGQQVPQDVQLWVQPFGNHVLRGRMIPEAEMQTFNGPLGLYNFICGAVFGMDADDFHLVNFRGILGSFHPRHGNADDVNLPLPNQTVSGELNGELGLLAVDGDVIGQFRISAYSQLVLLVIKWRSANNVWHFYKPRVHQWEEFRSGVREIFAYGVQVAQF